MSWKEVRNLESLSAMNMKIAEDALDDAVQYLIGCRRNLEEAQNQLKQVDWKRNGPSCIGYS